MIEGLIIKSLKVHADERGTLMEMLRADEDVFRQFGQAYVSLNYPGVVRAWHWHEKQWDYWVVIKGMVKAVCYDARENSPTKGQVTEVFLGDKDQKQIVIPPGVVHGYKTIGVDTAYLLNLPTEIYNSSQPDEFRLPYDSPEVPYNWDIKMH